MPLIDHAGKKVFYDFQDNGGPVLVFINGLTQNTTYWSDYKNFFAKSGKSTLCFDIPGQGQSDTPEQRLDFRDINEVIASLLNHLNIEKAYFFGLSFGATIVIQFAVQYPARIAGAVAIGGHSEKDTLFRCIHQALIDALNKGGIAYVYDFLVALNFSHEWIEQNQKTLTFLKKVCVANNSETAIRYFLETILDSADITDQLHRIESPFLIMCGEHDIFTPRWCQEILRENIPNSSMIVMQSVCHAFTIESPKLTKQIVSWFVQQVEEGQWAGDRMAWIASNQDPGNFKLHPCKRKKKGSVSPMSQETKILSFSAT